MGISFLTPFGALLGLLALVPLAAYLLRQRRAARIRAALRLDNPSLASRAPMALALVAVPALLGLAAAQPVVESERLRQERTDAEIWVVLDTSRSMLASEKAGSATRFERERDLTLQLNDALPDVRMGLASMTDHVLPHVFPTSDRRVVQTALRETMGIERPGPTVSLTGTPTTTFDSLAAIPTRNYFTPSAKKRLLVVMTDGETRSPEQDLSGPFNKRPPIETLVVRVGKPGEQIYFGGVPEDAYQPYGDAEAALSRVARQVDGQVLSEDARAVAAAAGRALGTGPTADRTIEGERRSLMPWVTLLAFLPLGFVLLRRNVAWSRTSP
jgi:von Willebrand factor type A domain